jgi:hypothetical protein
MTDILESKLERDTTADGRFFVPSATPEEIEAARQEWDREFTGANAEEALARYARGALDVASQRQTPEAEHYVRFQAIAELANRAFDVIR